MSERDEQSPLDKLPQPRSPQHLDEKILAQARQRAPRRSPPWRPTWITGMAAVSIAAMALLIVQPQLLWPGLDKLEELSDKRNALRRPSLATGRVELPIEEHSTSAREKAAPVTVPSELARKSTSVPGQAHLRAQRVPRMETPANADIHLETTVETAAESAPTMAPPPLHREQLDLRLAHCANLLEQGLDDQAASSYQTLRQECPTCDLPDTLEQALAQLTEPAE